MGDVGVFDSEKGYWEPGGVLRKYKQICFFCEKKQLDQLDYDTLECSNCKRTYPRRPLEWVQKVERRGRPKGSKTKKKTEEQKVN